MPSPSTVEQIEQLNASVTQRDTQIAALTADVNAAQALAAEAEKRAVTAENALTAVQAELSTAKDSLAAAESKVSQLTAANTELAAKEQDVEKRASARFAAMQASVGIAPPLPLGAPDTGKTTAKLTASPEDFRAMSALEQNAFMRKGGKIESN